MEKPKSSNWDFSVAMEQNRHTVVCRLNYKLNFLNKVKQTAKSGNIND